MNSILVLLVDELKELWLGKSVDGIFTKAAIECLACDLLVARKMGWVRFPLFYTWMHLLPENTPIFKDMDKVNTSGW